MRAHLYVLRAVFEYGAIASIWTKVYSSLRRRHIYFTLEERRIEVDCRLI
jgi:hypothetical protein